MPFKPYLISLTLLITVASCEPSHTNDLTGLWQLEHVYVDMIPKYTPIIILSFHADGTLAVSDKNGDQLGFFHVASQSIHFEGFETGWFGSGWDLSVLKERFMLSGKGVSGLNTVLTFKKIDTFPSFQAFEEQILGKWELYKMKSATAVQPVSSTILSLRRDQHYEVTDQGTVVENGTFTIDARHQKLRFHEVNRTWNVWFFGKELRMEDPSQNILYRLRK